MAGEKKEPRHQVIAAPADILPALTRLSLVGLQQLVFPESPQAEFPFFLSSHSSKNLTTNHQHAFNSPTDSGEEPNFGVTSGSEMLTPEP